MSEDILIIDELSPEPEYPDVSGGGVPYPPAPSLYQLMVLRGLQKKDHVYMGTVPKAVKERRRARGRVAKQSRKLNRSR